MMEAEQYHNATRWLSNCQHPLIVTHHRPDGDALGAVAGLTLALRALRKNPQPTLYEALPARYALLADTVSWRRWDLEREELQRAADALVILDTCAYSQLEPIAAFVRSAPPTLVVDHHPTRDEIATRPSDLRLIDASASAVCLLITEWLVAADLPLDAPTATALFTGLATDTGWFRFASTDARTLRAAADLAAAGAAVNSIYRAVYEQDPPGRIRLIGRMLERLELLAGGRLAVLRLRRADFAAAGADRSMTEDLVNEAGRIAGLEAMVLFTEEPNGQVRVNLRSKERVDVSRIAAQFGGGGHARASGARPTGAWEDIVQQVTTALLDSLSTE